MRKPNKKNPDRLVKYLIKNYDKISEIQIRECILELVPYPVAFMDFLDSECFDRTPFEWIYDKFRYNPRSMAIVMSQLYKYKPDKLQEEWKDKMITLIIRFGDLRTVQYVRDILTPEQLDEAYATVTMKKLSTT